MAIVQPNREQRTTSPGIKPEIRLIEPDDGGGMPVIEGYAAVFNQPSEDLGGFIEYIAPGAFTDSIKNDDVRALIDHDTGLSTIGRTSAGTLELSEDKHGLKYRVQPPDTSAGRDIVELIRRGDIAESSFAFVAKDDEWKTVDGQEIRTVLKAKVYDVSPVTFAAYEQTDVSVAQRSMAAHKAGEGRSMADLEREVDIESLGG